MLIFKNNISSQIERAISEFREARTENYFRHVVPFKYANAETATVKRELDELFNGDGKFEEFVQKRYHKIEVECIQKLLQQLGLTRTELISALIEFFGKGSHEVSKQISLLPPETLDNFVFSSDLALIGAQYKLFNLFWPNALATKLNFKESSWTPAHTQTDLMNSLKDKGPHVINGYFGFKFYSGPPLSMVDEELKRTVFYWKKNTHTIPNASVGHSVILIGAKPGFVYFVDPNDPYVPFEESQRIFVISYASLTAHAINQFGRKELDSRFALTK